VKEAPVNTLAEFITQFDSLIERWVRQSGRWTTAEVQDIKQDIYLRFLEKSYIETYDPVKAVRIDFATYVKLAVKRMLASRYRKVKKHRQIFSDSVYVSGEGEELSWVDYVPARENKHTVARWWNEHEFLRVEAEMLKPIVVKVFADKVLLVTPFLFVTLALLGKTAEQIIALLHISRVGYNSIRSMIQQKFGSRMMWLGEGGKDD